MNKIEKETVKLINNYLKFIKLDTCKLNFDILEYKNFNEVTLEINFYRKDFRILDYIFLLKNTNYFKKFIEGESGKYTYCLEFSNLESLKNFLIDFKRFLRIINN